jgi:hypothetical protein
MNLPDWHGFVHLGQIDFLQTCWDDQEVNLTVCGFTDTVRQIESTS